MSEQCHCGVGLTVGHMGCSLDSVQGAIQHPAPDHPPTHHRKARVSTRPPLAKMCMSEPLPRVDFKKRYLRNINDVNNPAEDLPDDANMLDAAQNDTPLDGDFITHEAHHLLRDPPRQTPWEAYEEIFTADTGIARREDRTSTPPPLEVHVFVNRWYESVKIVLDPRHEIGPRPKGLSRYFAILVREHLPTKLDLEFWVGDMVMDKLSKDESLKPGSFFQWRTWMGTNEERTTPLPAGLQFLNGYLGFIGTSGEGRLVWRQDRWGVPKNPDREQKRLQKDVTGKTRRAEANLVHLSIRIANWLAHWLTIKYAHDMMHTEDGVRRRRLTADDIANAVIEILGDEWFELPFDDRGKLKAWKNKRDFDMEEACFVHIIRP